MAEECSAFYNFVSTHIDAISYIFQMRLIYSRKGKEELLPASLVVSSQISGYSGGDVNANESVEITFPIKVH